MIYGPKEGQTQSRCALRTGFEGYSRVRSVTSVGRPYLPINGIGHAQRADEVRGCAAIICAG
jgi:hypothetical protein